MADGSEFDFDVKSVVVVDDEGFVEIVVAAAAVAADYFGDKLTMLIP